MNRCHVQASGAIELLFYGELDPARRESVEQHVASCAECRGALDELRVIRDALATRPDVHAPPDGDWTAFMSRLQDAVARDQAGAGLEPSSAGPSGWRASRVAPLLAMAALLALVTASVISLVQWRAREDANRSAVAADSAGPADSMPADASVAAGPVGSRDAAFAALSEQHLERSKLVVLKLASGGRTDGDLSYERRLASALLSDTRLYRITAEERGMTSLAKLMGDLELVLLQTSMSESLDDQTVEQIQRLIRKRDLVTQMTVMVP